MINPGTDTEMLDMLRASAARLVARDGLARVRAARGTTPGFARDIWREMAALGWCGLRVPPDLGGTGLGLDAALALVETLARGLVPEPFIATSLHAAELLGACPASARRDRILSAIAGGTLVVATGTQPGQVAQAQSDGAGVRLSGRIRHLVPGMGADLAIIPAQRIDDGGSDATLLLAVPADPASERMTPRLNADGTWSADVDLAGLWLEHDAVLASGAAARAAIAQGRVVAMLATAAALHGTMERALEITLDYMRVRVQFDQPIGAFQALQHRAVDLFIQKELSRAVLEEACAVADRGGTGTDRALLSAARAKARSTHAALLIGREAIKLHGAIGVTDECDVGLHLRRILALAPHHANAPTARAIACSGGQSGAGKLFDDAADLPPPPDAFLAEQRLEIDWNGFDDAAFRAGIRAYFDQHYPDTLRNLGRRGTPEEMAGWMERMVRKGWIAPAWPTEHGGMGLEPGKQIIFIEERERAGIARAPDQGVVMFGPMLMHHGTDAQKDRFLPGIVDNTILFCQGYSEPGAGSDLASLSTRATPCNGGFRVNGSKIWTTMAHHATHMFLLARTDPEARKQAGISFLILDLQTPGVTIRPIRNIAGNEEFCEVFFDDVFIPSENLVGKQNDGWRIAKSLLGYERLNNGSPRRVQGPLRSLEALARAQGLENDPVFRARYAELWLDIADLKSAYARCCDIVRSGGTPGPEVSMLKIWAGECAQHLSEFLIAQAGEAGGISGAQDFGGGLRLDVLAPYYAMFPAQIASGSSDIQRNILATRVLGLPRARRN